MIIKQFFDHFTAHSSYLLGKGPVCAIIDPRRDIDIYIEEAQRLEMKITHVFETHLHADFISGHIELAENTGAEIYGPQKAGFAFSHRGLKDGDSLNLADLKINVIETPGHTPEMINFVVSDKSVSKNNPSAIFSGDTLFVGDVGRPDMFPGRKEELAEKLFYSLKDKIFELPDYCEIYPAHGAGSLCGGNILSKGWSTIGFERNSNRLLKANKLDEFKSLLFANELPMPDHFKRCSEINRKGPALLKDIPQPVCINADEANKMLSDSKKIIVCDIRSYDAFGGQHIISSFNIDFNGIFGNYSGWMLPFDSEIIIVSENVQDAITAAKVLRRVGIDRKVYYINKGMDSWALNGYFTSHIPQLNPAELKDMADMTSRFVILDVRNLYEFESGNIDGAINIPVHELRYNYSQLNTADNLLVYCGSGKRSSLACSILEMKGFKHLFNIAGGYNAYERVFSNKPAIF
ncbi:MAG: MBL fold metallo-hydrolase [Actinobacteria bacterium]|nr:MBL fold metallo-hydrolase [Actinomycetota bacterium]